MVEQKIVTDTQVVVKVEWCKKESNWTMANSDWSHLGEVILPLDNAIAAVFGSVDVCKDNFDLDVIPITSVPSVKVKSFEKNLDGSYFMFLPTLY